MAQSSLRETIGKWPGWRVYKHIDFRILWIGSFLSFTGTQIQNVAQGDLVYQLTGTKVSLGAIAFFGMIPVTILGPILAFFSDILDRRKVLLWAMTGYAAGAGVLTAGIYMGWIQYWMILAVALVNGLIFTIEQPSRQSIVRSIVPPEDLSAAIPAQGMTFNFARSVGPAIGGLLTAAFGPAICFAINTVSYFGIFFATMKMKADLSPVSKSPEPIKDLIFEGMLYTFRTKALRVLFLMEATTSLCGIYYLSMMPAIVKDILGLDAKGLGVAFSCVGIGALLSLIVISSQADKQMKPLIIRIAMSTFAIAMFGLSVSNVPVLSFACLALLGASTMAQFNTTNTMFQLIAPHRLKGRVLAMHMWAVAGLSPIGSLMFGKLADWTNLPTVLLISSGVIAFGATMGWVYRKAVVEPKVGEEAGAS
ncbi:MAG: MFS transporter [Armatimonadetes bacterium]|nr:MFS transporter [Armatimonadota bacterium]